MTSNPQASQSTATLRDDRAEEQAARDHVRSLRQQGCTYRSIAQAARIAPMTIHGIAAGRTRPQTWTAYAVLAVSGDALARSRVDASGTRLRLRALHVMGHGSARIARAAGASEGTIRALVRGDARTISPRLRDAITTVYDAWWDKRAPERNGYERAAATAARRRAIAGNWCPPAALDDDELDNPGYQPAQGWRPAQGTGTATDPPLPLRRQRNQLPGSQRAPRTRPARPARHDDLAAAGPPAASRALPPSQVRQARR